MFAELRLEEGVERTGERRMEGFGVDGLRHNAVRLGMAWGELDSNRQSLRGRNLPRAG